MSDKQSDNSTDWAVQPIAAVDATEPAPPTDYTVLDLRQRVLPVLCGLGHDSLASTVQAMSAQAELDVYALEEQLAAARRVDNQLSALKAFAKYKPEVTQILNPPVPFGDVHHCYTMCMQMGYGFAVFNGTIHFAGRPGELMMDTTLKIGDL